MVPDERNQSDDDVGWLNEAALQREDELDGLRVRRIAAERRAANRFRSYLIIGGIVAAALVAQVVMELCR